MASRTAGALAASALAVHLAAGIGALWMLPHGFSIDEIRLWSNTLIPAAACLAVVAALIAFVVRRWRAGVSALVAAAAGGWTSAIITGVALFPVSMTLSRCAIPTVIALALCGLAWWARERRVITVVAIAAGAGIGAVVILAQRAPLPSTHPLGGTPAVVRSETSNPALSSGPILVPCGTREVRVYPLLTFTSRSPDRAWTILSPEQHGSHRTLARYETTPDGFRAAYIDDGESTLSSVETGDVREIEAVSTLHAPVYSHLNAFTSLHVPFEATLTFGPTGETRFPIEPAGYPSGRPVKLAYVDAEGTFRVVRARDAEKGPYSELAAGRLERGQPLILEIRPLDERDPGCRLVFEDWSAQLSTEPSPSAGWGVPQGTIQFFAQGGQGVVVLTLADTGPGRGFDSVGHAAGTYRNRLRVEPN